MALVLSQTFQSMSCELCTCMKNFSTSLLVCIVCTCSNRHFGCIQICAACTYRSDQRSSLGDPKQSNFHDRFSRQFANFLACSSHLNYGSIHGLCTTSDLFSFLQNQIQSTTLTHWMAFLYNNCNNNC